ncbi:MAG: M3 family metallopeptidase [Candidatus Krumholzibacteria bacterium]|nr:M3 family metallopeptidase [Candidatus Krumholzibacteria bacterium]
MRRPIFLVVLAVMLVISCAQQVGIDNPLLSEFDTPFGVPPFEEIKEAHYVPAFQEGIRMHNEEIAAIVEDTESPTFENTIAAMEGSGRLLDSVASIFFSLNSANTNEEMQAIAKEIAPLLAAHGDNIALNSDLFQKVKTVYLQKDDLGLNTEQNKVLTDYYKNFIRGGADLGGEDKATLREINQELSVLSLQFGENILKETNRFELIIDNEKDLAGLPEASIVGAAETATSRGYEGKWVFTTSKPSMVPFIQYAENRDLREKIYKAYINRGDNDDEFDNKKILSRMAALRVKKANLLGYETHAHFILEQGMAKNPANVYIFLDKIWLPALAKAKEERAMMQKMIDDEGDDFKLQSWDWWYYAEKVKKVKYDLDEEMIKPYFQLDNVINGAFAVANKLWGITFEERTDIPKYHPDVKTFEVKEADGTHIGILLADYFPRESKRGGAWCGTYRQQCRIDGKMITPIVNNVGNFQKPTADKPALLTWDDVLTLFHEFGHGLHNLLSAGTYPSVTATNVATDFVELPSQIMENWAGEPEVLAMYATHYETGEVIPEELVTKMKNASKFNQGFAATEYLAASYLDMDWHTLRDTVEQDVDDFETASLSRIGLIPEIISRYRSTYYRHIFTSGYSAGYFSYMWAEVLDADAFQAFKEAGIFDQELAQSFRVNILAAGGSEDPMTLYKKFRGKEPGIEPLLKKRGLI